MILVRAALALGISIVALLISVALDTLLAPLPTALQVTIQIPALILSLDAFRQWLHARIPPTIDLNPMFFLTAPLAAFASPTLFRELRLLLR
jgi:hypothetical protein